MACDLFIWGLLMFGCSIQALLVASEDDPLEYMSKEERKALKFVLFLNFILNIKYNNILNNIITFLYVFFVYIFLLTGKKLEICFVMHIMLIW